MRTRINKFLSESGRWSRREADRLISDGRVFLNGKSAKLGDIVEDDDGVVVNGEPVIQNYKTVYLAYNKPTGIEVTTNRKVEKNILDAVGYPTRLFPIGRLDKNSSGLILLTNDGDIVNKILRPSEEHEKEYIVHIFGEVNDSFLKAMENGAMIFGKKTKPCRTAFQNTHAFRIILTEGMNRQIRRMADSAGEKVTAIKRVRIMNIKLGKLPNGEWRNLTNAEKRELFVKLKYRK
ncbi:MAG: pseudouridine synthase [Patescibacteria group bacterium]